MTYTMNYDKNTAIRIRDFLLKQGITLEGVYGMMANIYSESGFRSNNAQNSYMNKMGMTDEIYTSKVDNGTYTNFIFDRVGYGLCQWTSSGRKQNLYNFAKSCGKSIGDETMQLNFLMKELNGSYKAVLNVLKTSHNISECAKYVMTKFERPADQSITAQNKRANYGIQLFDELGAITVNVKEEETKMSYKIAIDAGHGSWTAGKCTPDGYKEHWINVDVADFLEDALLRCGFDILKVAWDDDNATDDTDVALTTRQSQIKAANCDVSVSCHANAYGDGASYNSGQGVETLIHNNSAYVGDSRNLANKVQSYLINGTTQKNRGVKTSNLAMCNCVAMGTKASILVEIGFMTNQREADLMKTEAFCKECAEEIAHGICDYFGVTYKSSGTPTPSTTTTPSSNTTSTPTVNITYAVQIEGGKVLPTVTNLADYAGIENKKITGIAMKVDKGSVKYQVHVLGGDWLPYVTGYNWSDHNNGYAGNGKPIDAIRIYYTTPSSLVSNGGYREAKYRISPIGSTTYYSWQLDDTVNKAKGMDGYAGAFGKAIDKFQVCIE